MESSNKEIHGKLEYLEPTTKYNSTTISRTNSNEGSHVPNQSLVYDLGIVVYIWTRDYFRNFILYTNIDPS